MIDSAGMYTIRLDIPSLRATSSDTYTCTVTVMPDSGSLYVSGSESESSLDITVGKLLSVQLFSSSDEFAVVAQ